MAKKTKGGEWGKPRSKKKKNDDREKKTSINLNTIPLPTHCLSASTIFSTWKLDTGWDRVGDGGMGGGHWGGRGGHQLAALCRWSEGVEGEGSSLLRDNPLSLRGQRQILMETTRDNATDGRTEGGKDEERRRKKQRWMRAVKNWCNQETVGSCGSADLDMTEEEHVRWRLVMKIKDCLIFYYYYPSEVLNPKHNYVLDLYLWV